MLNNKKWKFHNILNTKNQIVINLQIFKTITLKKIFKNLILFLINSTTKIRILILIKILIILFNLFRFKICKIKKILNRNMFNNINFKINLISKKNKSHLLIFYKSKSNQNKYNRKFKNIKNKKKYKIKIKFKIFVIKIKKISKILI